MYTYCLFCETGKCDTLAKLFEIRFPCRAISPKQVQHTWSKKQKAVDRVRDLLPGYLFLYFEDEKPNISQFWGMNGVIKCLSGKDEEYKRYELSGSDEAFAMTILQHDGVIGKTQVYQEGDRIRIRSGVFEGLATRILKVDRRSSRMQIEIPFANQLIKTWVEYEIVAPENDQGATASN